MLSKLKRNPAHKDSDASSGKETGAKEMLMNESLKIRTSVKAGAYLGLTFSGGSGGVVTKS